MTGVEAVSNGVPTFREPVVKNARITLTIIMTALILMLIMIAFVSRAFHIGATQPGTPEYKTVLYSLVLAVTGKGWLSFIPIASILLIVVFQANTSFSGFPRLCSNVARNNFLPQNFANRGRRLVYSSGIVILSVFSGILLIAFKGVTDSLIPLFAVGAFIAFTLSQAGMVIHWKRNKGSHWRQFMIINGVGMVATAVTTLVVLVTKFTEGAWIVILALAAILLFMKNVNRHYTSVRNQLYCNVPLKEDIMKKSIVVLPADEWNNNVSKALSFAITISDEIIIFYVFHENEDEKTPDEENDIQKNWKQLIEDPLKKANLPVPRLKVYKSPYRLVVEPIIDYVLELEAKNPERDIAVLVPNLVERKWYQRFLHNQRSLLIAGLLFYRGSRRTVIIYVPWYLKKENE